ncbi:uncharacterized protein [Temnothorax longispinosus]|uniref:uncharacterized protein n=1 Tax=Temnothorax longispinosus TaxID=300112 RepID=UPI003A9980FC
MMGTGGGSPKDLQLSATEDALIKFLTPDASGLKDISEGGFTDVMPSYDNNKTLSLSTSSYNIKEKQDKTEDIFLNDNSNDELLESYEAHSPIQQNKQHMESVSMLSSNTNMQNIRNIHAKQRKRSIEPNTKVKKYDETFALSLHNVKNVHQNKENLEQDSKTTCETTVSLDDTEKYITKRSEGAKKPRLMATAINLLEKKSTLSENIKQEMLDLKKEKLALKREEVNTFKAILQQLQNMNDNVTSLREDLCPQYLTTDVQEGQEVEDEVQESCLSP